MKNKIVNIFFPLLASIFVMMFACNEILPSVNAPANYPGTNYNEIFEAFWTGMNNNYVYWSHDPTNWDSVYRKYKPLFTRLDNFEDASNATAERYFTEMTSRLIDSHFTLNFQLTGTNVSPSFNRKLEINQTHPDSIYSLPADFFKTITSRYIDAGSIRTGTDTISLQDADQPFTVTAGIIQNNILYLYFSDFAFSQAGSNTGPILTAFFNTLSQRASSLRGVIIDVRGNGGGEITGLNFLLGRMVTAPVTYAYTRTKSGNGRLDYSVWAPAILAPQRGAVAINQPIVILADHLSTSMSEITALAVKALPNGHFIGTTTWGATGPLVPGVFFNGGQFTIGTSTFGNNGYVFVYTSSAELKSLEGDVYEGIGVPPDQWVPETGQAYRSGIDSQLEAAIKYISNPR